MKTKKQLQQIANDIIEEARDYPADDRYEVLEELIRCTTSDEELGHAEARQVFEMVSARV